MRTFSFLFVFFIYSFAFAQSDGRSKVSLNINEKPVRELLASVQHQTRLKFSFNSKLIDQDSIVSYRCKNRQITHIIADLSNNKITSKRIGRHIVLVENEKAIEKQQPKKLRKQTPQIFSGIVIHARTNLPIDKASIYDAYTRETVMSDRSGQFKITVAPIGRNKTYVVSRAGFKDTIIALSTTQQNLNIGLMPLPVKIAHLAQKETGFVTIQQKSNFLYGFVPQAALITSENLKNVYEHRTYQVSLFPKLGTNWMSSGVISNSMSLNIAAGYNGALTGLEIGGALNMIGKSTKGVQIAGLSNLVAENVLGVQVAGVLNKSGGELVGTQVAGVANMALAKVSGVQASGVFCFGANRFQGVQVSGLGNVVRDDVIGLQMTGLLNIGESIVGIQTSGIVNVVSSNSKGIQLTGISNWSSKTLSGAQISGLLNWSQQNLNGIQISGLVNCIGDTLRGVQHSGLYNKARVNNGVQIGIVNVADEADGIAIGLLNYVKNGYRALELSTNEMFYSNLTFKMGSRHFYTIYKLGFRPTKTPIYGAGFGFGTNIRLSQKLSLSFDGTISIFAEEIQRLNENLNNRLDITLNFQPQKRIYFALGPSLNVNHNFNKNNKNIEPSALMSPLYSETQANTQTELRLGGCFAIGYRF